MTIEVQGQHAGDAVFVYNDEPARIPLRHVHVLSHNALVRDQGGCAYGGRWYDRDALLRLRTDLDTGALAELDTCTEHGCEEAEHPDPTQARPRCARHLKDPR